MILFTKYLSWLLWPVVLDVEAELGKVMADEIVAVAVTSEASVLVASEASDVIWMHVQKACLETMFYMKLKQLLMNVPFYTRSCILHLSKVCINYQVIDPVFIYLISIMWILTFIWHYS